MEFGRPMATWYLEMASECGSRKPKSVGLAYWIFLKQSGRIAAGGGFPGVFRGHHM
jgi:hypothetical protein